MKPESRGGASRSSANNAGQFVCYFLGYILRPAHGRVERDHVDRIGIRTAPRGDADHCLAVGSLLVNLALGAAKAFAEVVQHQVNLDVIR
jgi:hypothetical protein